jgi:hypothetical protein
MCRPRFVGDALTPTTATRFGTKKAATFESALTAGAR